MSRVFQILSLGLSRSSLAVIGAALFFCAPVMAKGIGPSDVKAEALDYLKDMRVQNVKRLREIDQGLRSRIEDSNPGVVEFEVTRLKTAKREHLLRQEFLDRLILQIDVRFNGGDLRQFLERALTEMAKNDATANDSKSGTDNGLWKFLKFAADAVRRLPEKKENILVFLEGYMNRSVADPIRPEDYLNTRNYSNGLDGESGKPLARDEVGAVADSRLREIPEEPVQPMPPANLTPVKPVTPAPEPASEPAPVPGPATNP